MQKISKHVVKNLAKICEIINAINIVKKGDSDCAMKYAPSSKKLLKKICKKSSGELASWYARKVAGHAARKCENRSSD